MAVGVVQEEEGASAQHFACTPDESAGNQSNRCRQACGAHPRRPQVGDFQAADTPTGQSLEVQAARASVSLSSPPERASWRETAPCAEAVARRRPVSNPRGIACIPLQITGAPQVRQPKEEQGQQRLTGVWWA